MQAKRHRRHLALQYLRTENDAFIVEDRTGWSMIFPLSAVPPSPSPPLKGFADATNGNALDPST